MLRDMELIGGDNDITYQRTAFRRDRLFARDETIPITGDCPSASDGRYSDVG